MERVAEDVKDCLKQATFGTKPLCCYRGITPKDFIFTDESRLETFLSLTEDQRLQFTNPDYHPSRTSLWKNLVDIWKIEDTFASDCVTDHAILQNEHADIRTCWRDKYTTSIYSPNPSCLALRHELQPLPDFIRWVMTKSCTTCQLKLGLIFLPVFGMIYQTSFSHLTSLIYSF